jgi:hypothetical protein
VPDADDQGEQGERDETRAQAEPILRHLPAPPSALRPRA